MVKDIKQYEFIYAYIFILVQNLQRVGESTVREASNWQETASMYKQLFVKPKMKEIKLKKPSFKYILKIFTATMHKTGWGLGLF